MKETIQTNKERKKGGRTKERSTESKKARWSEGNKERKYEKDFFLEDRRKEEGKKKLRNEGKKKLVMEKEKKENL